MTFKVRVYFENKLHDILFITLQEPTNIIDYTLNFVKGYLHTIFKDQTEHKPFTKFCYKRSNCFQDVRLVINCEL